MNEQDFQAEIADLYVRKGWEVEDAEQASAFLPFRPDLVLRRGDEHLVVEIMRPGFPAEHTIPQMRKLVEVLPNWRLVVKLMPPERELPEYRIASSETPGRLELAESLVQARRYADALLICWVIIEANLRRLCAESIGAKPDTTIPDLLRIAYEEDVISDPELRQLQRGLQLRNRIVHGYEVGIADDDARSFLSLARALTDRAEHVAA